jgi:hypothetical protein
MVGSVAPATTAPAKTSAAKAVRSDPIDSGVAANGNNVAASGRNLPPAPPPPPVVDVERAVARLNEIVSGTRRSLRFQVDEGSGRTVITVINEATQEIVRQIPPEELLALERSIESLGSLLDTWI